MDKDLITRLTLEQKARLLSGDGLWHTVGYEKPYVPSVMMTDGPHGLRKQTEDQVADINSSAIATCFPTAVATASSWDTDIAYSIGDAIGKEALHEQVSTVLGCGVNIKRSPLGGRNFEYFSEEPFLAGRIAAAWIDGVQSNKVGTSLKHYAVNSQEKSRMKVDSVVDERTLREIYLSAFEYVVKNSQPTTIMSAYNKVNGEYCSQNKFLLTDVLRNEWGFEGIVISDWGATYDVVESIRNGLDLQMPGNGKLSPELLVKAVNDGVLREKELDRAVQNVLKFVFDRKHQIKENYPVDLAKHHLLAKDCASESAVLLKNDGILHLNKKKEILVIGELAENMRYQGSGSSHINTVITPNLLDAMRLETVKFEFAKGYSVNDALLGRTEESLALEKEALQKAENYDVVLFVGGLTDQTEGEGYDRESFDLPASQNSLVMHLCEMGKKVVVLLVGGSPYSMPWKNDVSAILNMYLAGQGVGEAACELLYGIKNPCGKLAETWPLSIEDTPCYPYFLTKRSLAEHREGIFVGYRYYDTFNIPTLFDFGFGLSYTQFEYSNFVVKKNNIHNYTVSVTVKNVGKESGKEIVQLYIASPKDSKIIHAKRQLKGFIKTDMLAPQEQQDIQFSLDKRSFAFFDLQSKNWQVEKGNYDIEISASLHDTKFSKTVSVEGIEPADQREVYSNYFSLNNGKLDISDQQFSDLLDRPLATEKVTKKGEFTLANSLSDMGDIFIVKIVKKIAQKEAYKLAGGDMNSPVAKMTMYSIMEMPLISMAGMTNGKMSVNRIYGILYWANGRPFKAIATMLKKDDIK